MVPLLRVQTRQTRHAGPVDWTYCVGHNRAISCLVDAAHLRLVIKDLDRATSSSHLRVVRDKHLRAMRQAEHFYEFLHLKLGLPKSLKFERSFDYLSSHQIVRNQFPISFRIIDGKWNALDEWRVSYQYITGI